MSPSAQCGSARRGWARADSAPPASPSAARPPRAAALAALLLAAAASAASAQPSIGVIGGVSRVGFTGGGSTDVGPRTTLLIGAVGEIPLGGVFSIRPELHYSDKGAPLATLLGDPSRPRKLFRLPYLQMPVLAQLRARAGALRPRVFGGVSVGALLGCELGGADCGDVEGIGHRSVDVGMLVGGEIEWRGVAVGVRYESGIRAAEASISGNELYNGALSGTVRYLFGQRPEED